MRSRGILVAFALMAVFYAAILCQWLIVCLAHWAAAAQLSAAGDLNVVLLFVQTASALVVGLAVPPGVVLHVLGVRTRWVYLLAGVLSGWLSMLAAMLTSGWLGTFAAPIVTLQQVRLFAHVVGPTGLFWLGLFGLLFGWFWSMEYYRLPGDNRRDWQQPVQARNPLDLF